VVFKAIAETRAAFPESAATPSIRPTHNSYAPYFPTAVSPDAQASKRRSRLLQTIGISSLAGVIGVAAYLCYREARAWLATSKESGQGTETSQGLASAPDIASEIAAVSASNASAAPGTPEAHEAGAPTAQAPASPQAAPAAGEMFLVQVAAYTTQAEALNLVGHLREQHFIAFVKPPINDAYYRVQLGPYTTREAAQIGKRELEKAGFTPFIRH
jgi:cell division septation protein DedD